MEATGAAGGVAIGGSGGAVTGGTVTGGAGGVTGGGAGRSCSEGVPNGESSLTVRRVSRASTAAAPVASDHPINLT